MRATGSSSGTRLSSCSSQCSKDEELDAIAGSSALQEYSAPRGTNGSGQNERTVLAEAADSSRAVGSIDGTNHVVEWDGVLVATDESSNC